MELSSRFVGTALKDYRTEINWRDTMNYAAALDDNNPRYFDDERDGGIIAPPMFSVAVTWPIIEKIWDFIEAKDFPVAIMATQVHYTEHLEFFRPIRPEDALIVKGKIAAILPHRAGTHVVLRFDATDRNGDPVFTEHVGAMMRGVTCADQGRGEDALPSVPSFKVEDPPIWEEVIPIDAMRAYLYDGCANIFFPIHTSKSFARQLGLPGNILQGTATLGFAVREIINREAGGNPLRLQSLSGRFTGIVLPGTEIRVRLMRKRDQKEGQAIHFNVINQEGQKAISNGYAQLK
ncbi:MAG: MaoC/PaaZ C-terminal domain-containing protein [Desulfobacteraceae bacterium]